MKIPLLFHHLEYFTDNDYVRFIKYLKSPFHNYYLKSYSDILKIVKKYQRLLTVENHKELRDIVVKKLSCSENTALTIFSRLSDLVIEYFKVASLESKDYDKEYSLCEHLLSIGYYNILDNRISLCWNILDKSGKPDEDTYLKTYQLSYLSYKSSVQQDSKISGDKAIVHQQDMTLNSVKSLFVYTLSKLIVGYLDYTIQNIATSHKNPSPFPVHIKPMFGLIAKPEFQLYDQNQKALIELYHYLFIMFENLDDDKAYYRYKKYFYKIKSMFNKEFSKSHFSVLTNYCYLRQRVNDRNVKFSNEGLKILNDYINNKMYINDNSQYLSPILYRNFIIKCNYPETKNILEDFVKTQITNVHRKHRKDMRNFGNAYLNYLKKDFKRAWECISCLNHPQFMYKYDIRNLKLKIYFDEKNYVKLNSSLHNYLGNVNNEDMFTDNDKEKYKLMLINFNALLKIDEKYNLDKDNITDYEYLLKGIISGNGFIMKQWFVEKIKSIIKSHYSKKVLIKK